MQFAFDTVKNIFSYKESKDKQQFELLESNNEKNEQPQDKSNNNKVSRKQKEQKPILSIQEWNESRNEDMVKQQQNVELVDSLLDVNLENIRQEFNMPKNQDVVIRQFKIAHKVRASLVYIDGMVDRRTVNDIILRQLMTPDHFCDLNDEDIIDYIMDNVLSINQISKEKKFVNVNFSILNGMTALFIDGCNDCILMETRGFEKRNIEKPSTETVIRGSQESFTENLRTNLTLIRRIIKNKNLITEMLAVGKTNNSNCAILYLDGIADPELVNEVKRRIKSIDSDFVMGDGMLEQYIEDSPFMIFPQVLSTERPDRATSFIMEGQVIIISEGAPFANVVPVTFFHMIHTSEDSFLRWQYGTFLRIIRIFALFIATFLPGLYVALTLFHQEMIPTELLSSIAQAREVVPFPTIFEIVMMEFSFELIREAGIRVPGVIGQTLGIIGALILGQAAVAANLVSPVLIIIVAVTGLGNFTVPVYTFGLGIRIVRFMFIILGAIAGFYGVAIGIFITFGLACSMKSFGVPFFAPIAPATKRNPDLVIRQPIWRQQERPDYLNTQDRKRQGEKSRQWIYNKGGGDKND